MLVPLDGAMASLIDPIHISVQKPIISSLYLLPRRVSTKTNDRFLQSRVLDAKHSSLVFPLLLEKGKHLVPLQASLSKSVKPSKSFGGRFPAFFTAFFYIMWYFLNVLFYRLKNKYLPHPYFVFVAHLLVTVGYCLIGWALGVRESHIFSAILELLMEYIPWAQLKVLVISFVSLIFGKR